MKKDDDLCWECRERPGTIPMRYGDEAGSVIHKLCPDCVDEEP